MLSIGFPIVVTIYLKFDMFHATNFDLELILLYIRYMFYVVHMYSCILRFNYEMMSMNYRNFLDQLEKWGQIKNELF